MVGGLNGVRLIESELMVIGPFEDWSRVRSPGRAARRRAQGHRQNISYFHKPDPKVLQLPDGTLVMHPVTAAQIRRQFPEITQ